MQSTAAGEQNAAIATSLSTDHLFGNGPPGTMSDGGKQLSTLHGGVTRLRPSHGADSCRSWLDDPGGVVFFGISCGLLALHGKG